MEKQKIEVGQIWEVVDENFFGSKSVKELSKAREARFHLKVGEKFEIRYAYEWNYRAEDGLYLHSDPDYILEKCKLFGTVDPNVRSNNKASLEEILRLDLYVINKEL
jgi:hypothetical protein